MPVYSMRKRSWPVGFRSSVPGVLRGYVERIQEGLLSLWRLRSLAGETLPIEAFDQGFD
jgi:hypothetical protein